MSEKLTPFPFPPERDYCPFCNSGTAYQYRDRRMDGHWKCGTMEAKNGKVLQSDECKRLEADHE
jgi:hypothetical protein